MNQNEKNPVEIALTMFSQGHNCAQSVLAAFGDETGLDRKTTLTIAAAFGGGMARMGLTCGAITGALMVLGLKSATINNKDKFYELITEFIEKFRAANGDISCTGLLGCSVATPEGKTKAKELCHNFVRSAVELIEEM